MDERTEFIQERRDSYTTEVEPWGSVEVEVLPEVTVYAHVGGWQWEARGVDRLGALQRLERRLHGLSPFEGTETDWGPPGEAMGDPLAETIPEHTRQRMRDYQSLIDPNLLPDDE